MAAPFFCAAMGAPDATAIVRVLAASVVIDGVVATSAALLQRDFRAGRRMAIDQVNSWLGAIVSISCALAGMGAMSLAVGRHRAALVAAVMFIHAEPVRFGFDREIARKLLRFGVPLAASSVVVFGVKFVDQFIVGSLLGPVALGFYVLAFNLSNWPVRVFSQPVRDVSPAAFSRLRGDPPALRSAFVSSVGLLDRRHAAGVPGAERRGGADHLRRLRRCLDARRRRRSAGSGCSPACGSCSSCSTTTSSCWGARASSSRSS